MSDEMTMRKMETDKRFGIAVTAIQDMLVAVQTERGLAEAKVKQLENLLNVQKKAEGDKA
jgi:hypothetical protein